MTSLEERALAAWPPAQRVWASSILLAAPVVRSDVDPLAYTDLATREVVLNGKLIEKLKLADHLEGILAHEIGHHLRFPGTLSTAARLEFLERQLLPLREGSSIINLFTDFLINEHVGQTHRDSLIAVYTSSGSCKGDPVFSFYLAGYEALWGLDDGALLRDAAPWMDQEYAGYRGEAQILAQDLFNLGPNLYTQFLYFASVFARYIPLEKWTPAFNPFGGDHGGAEADDYADALWPSAAEQEAIDKALREGWIPGARRKEWDPKEVTARRIASIPGMGGGTVKMLPAIMATHYRRLAAKYIFEPPPEKRRGDPLVPVTLEDWEPGDAVREIDWRATVSRRGDELGAAQPLKREFEEAEGESVRAEWRPRMEIYLDVSGSMPDPKLQINAMTLSAQILALSTLRHGGKVRALIYSSGTLKSWEWVRSERKISEFLMSYIGGGTTFPWAVLQESVVECRQEPPIRIVITDPDFDYNVKSAKAAPLLEEAVKASRPLVLLLHRPVATSADGYRRLGAKVVAVTALEDFPRMARELAASLFGGVKRAP